MTPAEFAQLLSRRLRPSIGRQRITDRAGKITALSRLLWHDMADAAPIAIWIHGWSVWPSHENLDLFYGYRRSCGEVRPLIEASFHLFDANDSDAFVSILSLTWMFGWDAKVFDLGGTRLLSISHDEWIEVQADDAIWAEKIRSDAALTTSVKS